MFTQVTFIFFYAVDDFWIPKTPPSLVLGDLFLDFGQWGMGDMGGQSFQRKHIHCMLSFGSSNVRFIGSLKGGLLISFEKFSIKIVDIKKQ